MTGNALAVVMSRPDGVPGDENFAVVEAPMPVPGPDEVLVETLYVSVDPYVRVAIDERTTTVFGAAQPLGSPLMGRSVARVVETRSRALKVGDVVLTHCGWQRYVAAKADTMVPVNEDGVPLTWWLGVLGTTGFAAYVGATQVAPPESGQTYVVTSAAGATGSIAGQIARLRGAKVVGVAGAPEKCAYVVDDLGFDACVSHLGDDLVGDLARHCPGGIDHAFENVGGRPLEAVLENIKPGGIVALCGVIGSYNDGNRSPGPNLWPLIRVGASIRGFRLPDYQHLRPAFIRDMLRWTASGEIRHREEILEGLDAAGEAYRRLMSGRSMGKLVVKIAHDTKR